MVLMPRLLYIIRTYVIWHECCAWLMEGCSHTQCLTINFNLLFHMEDEQIMKNLISALCVFALVAGFSVAQAADLAELESRVEALEAKTGGLLGGVELYGSFRPSVRLSTYDGDNDDESERDDETDIRDNLSRLGVKGSVDLDNGWSAFYRGEWRVNIGDDDASNDGGTDFGEGRLAYVGLGTPFGEVAFGQRWNTYYNIVAEVTDIYEHVSSPFGWDFNGPFRTPSMVTYKHNIGNLNIQAGGRFNGGESSSEHRHADEYNIGAAYRFDAMNAYLGVAFRNTQGGHRVLCGAVRNADGDCTVDERRSDGQDTDWWAVGGSINPTDQLYLAFTYQDGEQDDAEIVNNDSADLAVDDADKESLDIVVSYDFGGGWNGIVGYFDSEDDSDARGDYDGYNLTLKKHLNSNMHV